jgi:hypothetical protein
MSHEIESFILNINGINGSERTISIDHCVIIIIIASTSSLREDGLIDHN